MKIHGWKKVNRYRWRLKNRNLEIVIKRFGFRQWKVYVFDEAFGGRLGESSPLFQKYTEAENFAIRKQSEINAKIRSAR